jgi:hypothetical protein
MRNLDHALDPPSLHDMIDSGVSKVLTSWRGGRNNHAVRHPRIGNHISLNWAARTLGYHSNAASASALNYLGNLGSEVGKNFAGNVNRPLGR